ncbi:hypothetical protein EV715DRAFT_297729 [Schizophyllum commune]
MGKRFLITASGLEPEFDAAYHRRRRTAKAVRENASKWLLRWSTRCKNANERNASILYCRDQDDVAQDGLDTTLILCPKCEGINYRPCSLNCGHTMCAFCVVELLAGSSVPPSQRSSNSFCAQCGDRNHLSTKPICLESMGGTIETLYRQLSLHAPRSLPTYDECNALIATFYSMVFTPRIGPPTQRAVG